jgi:hypothetical protein
LVPEWELRKDLGKPREVILSLGMGPAWGGWWGIVIFPEIILTTIFIFNSLHELKFTYLFRLLVLAHCMIFVVCSLSPSFSEPYPILDKLAPSRWGGGVGKGVVARDCLCASHLPHHDYDYAVQRKPF